MLEPRTDDPFRLVIDFDPANAHGHVIRPGGFQDGGRWFLSGEGNILYFSFCFLFFVVL